jgi:hypothetical protein
MGLLQMSNERLTKELDNILSLLDEHKAEVDALQEKFRVALTGILRLVGVSTPILTNLQANTEDLKGYLIQLNIDVSQATTQSYQSLRNKIEEIQELVSSTDRKS